MGPAAYGAGDDGGFFGGGFLAGEAGGEGAAEAEEGEDDCGYEDESDCMGVSGRCERRGWGYIPTALTAITQCSRVSSAWVCWICWGGAKPKSFVAVGRVVILVIVDASCVVDVADVGSGLDNGRDVCDGNVLDVCDPVAVVLGRFLSSSSPSSPRSCNLTSCLGLSARTSSKNQSSSDILAGITAASTGTTTTSENPKYLDMKNKFN